MLNVETLFGLETVSETVLLIELQTPAASSTDQTKNTETTVTIPNAIASTNDTFITDQGSMRLSRSRALRGPVAAPSAGGGRGSRGARWGGGPGPPRLSRRGAAAPRGQPALPGSAAATPATVQQRGRTGQRPPAPSAAATAPAGAAAGRAPTHVLPRCVSGGPRRRP